MPRRLLHCIYEHPIAIHYQCIRHPLQLLRLKPGESVIRCPTWSKASAARYNMSAHPAARSDWGRLQPELVEVIYKEVVSAGDRRILRTLNKHWAAAIADTVQQLRLSLPEDLPAAQLVQHVARLAIRFQRVLSLNLVTHLPGDGVTALHERQLLPYTGAPGPVLRGWGLRSFDWTSDRYRANEAGNSLMSLLPAGLTHLSEAADSSGLSALSGSTTRSGAVFRASPAPAWACSIQSAHLPELQCRQLLRHSAALSQLTSLTCRSWSKFSAAEVQNIAALTGLRELQLGFYYDPDSSGDPQLPLDALASLSRVSMLGLEFGYGNPHQLPPHLPALRDLKLVIGDCQDPMSALGGYRHLTSLRLEVHEYHSLAATDLTQLHRVVAGMGSLRRLALVNVCPEDSRVLGQLPPLTPGITSLHLTFDLERRVESSDQAALLRAFLPACGLQVLALSQSDGSMGELLRDRGHRCLSELRSLEIDLCWGAGADPSWAVLPSDRMPQLTELKLTDYDLVIDPVSLAACNTLRKLSVGVDPSLSGWDSFVDPTADLVAALQLPGLSQLTALSFRCVGMCFTAYDALGSHCALIESLSGLQQLRLLELDYGNDVLTALWFALPPLAALETLELGNVLVDPAWSHDPEVGSRLLYDLKKLPSLKRVAFKFLTAADVADARSFAEQAAECWEVSCDFVREYTGDGLIWLEEWLLGEQPSDSES